MNDTNWKWEESLWQGTECIMEKKERWMFWTILLGAILIRCIGFGIIPGGINQDEAMAAVDAWALSKYGTDRFGTYMPVHFEAWKYGQMSVLLSYCMIPFLKLFGFHIFSVRMPMLLASCGSVALMYLIGKKLLGKPFGYVAMALTAISPWHFMQSRWSLDCNLFPHVFLLAFYLLLLGLEKRRYLYLSMIFFGLTFYCYGVAVYSVTPFLVVYAGWCLWKKQLKLREVLGCVVIFLLTALPEILVMAINMFGWDTIETPFFTMSYFPYSVRSADILLLNFSFAQLWRNFYAMFTKVFLQYPDELYNALPKFGPLYHISIPFVFLGIGVYIRDFFREKDSRKQAPLLALGGTLLMGIWTGLMTYEVNINRINIIFLPVIFFCAYGIVWTVGKWKKLKGVLIAGYSLCLVLFLGTYFTEFARDIQYYFNADFVEAMEETDRLEQYEKLYITGHMGWQFNMVMADILTQYACQLDAAYCQGKTNRSEGKELLPYTERYQYIDVKTLQQADPEGLYVVNVYELNDVPFSYTVQWRGGNYVLLTVEAQ